MTSPPAVLDPRPAAVEAVALADLVAQLPVVRSVQADDILVCGLTLASADVRRGDLYAALPGRNTHGASFVPAALRAGAAAVLTDPSGADALYGALPAGVPLLVVADPRAVLGDLAAAVYRHPAEQMLTLGVTGTNGKTTVTYLLESALRSAGRTPGLVGTTGSRAAGRPVASRLTTPEAPDLHALLAVMREQGVDSCALEVSSHALVQGRVDGLVFDLAVFLNLGRDHLDFHRDEEEYFDAKAGLFTAARARRAVVDVGDGWGRRLAAMTSARGLPLVTCSADADVPADWQVAKVRVTAQGSDFVVVGPDGRAEPAHLPLPGMFNVRNALAAVAGLVECGLPLATVLGGLAVATGVPGRMERVDEGQDFVAIVDYAHKPDAVEALLGALRPVTRGRLLVVLGAGGDRDPGKRPLMGRVASGLADVLVVTDDNPRGEDPAAIRAQVIAGIDVDRPRAELVEEPDRATAIRAAVALAEPGDTVVVSGKGHETGQQVGEHVHPFDDRDVLRAALRHRLSQRSGDRS